MKTTVELAREAGIRDCTCNGTKGCLERLVELARADERERLLAVVETPEPETLFPREMRVELLDHVSACQSAYSMESNGSRFAIAGQLKENRQALLDYVLEILQGKLRETVAAAVARKDAEIDALYKHGFQIQDERDALKAEVERLKAAVSDEREACAKLCADLGMKYEDDRANVAVGEDEPELPHWFDCKLAIEARGNT